MGTQATGTTGSTSSTRQGWALLGAVLVAAFAGILYLGGADAAEVVATMLFAAVFGAALLGGRTAGFVAAAVATVLYAWLRRDSADDAGMMRLGVVVLGRAASYVVLAYVADLMGDRLPPLPFGGASARGEADGAGSALRPLEPAPVEMQPVELQPLASGQEEAAHGWEPGPAGPWEPASVPQEAAWQPAPEQGAAGANGYHDAPYDPYQPVGADEPVPEGPDYGSWSPAAQGWDQAGTEEQWSPSVRGGAQAVPSGWLHDDDYGDEIPVGYTGELFLQDLTGSQGQAQDEPGGADGRGNGDDVPMIDGMPFGQPIEPREPRQPVEPRQPLDPRGRDQVGWRPRSHQEQRYTPAQNEQIWTTDDALGHDGWTAPPPASTDLPGSTPNQPYYVGREPTGPAAEPAGGDPAGHLDPETRLWTASYFRDRLAAEYDEANVTGTGFSVVMIQIPDTPFRTLSRRREVALLRELGHQFIRAQIVDHLVHLPDGNHHWFAAVLPDIDRGGAHAFERRLRAAIAGYLRNRGLSLEDIQSATLTSPDDDETMSQIWSSLLGEGADQAYY